MKKVLFVSAVLFSPAAHAELFDPQKGDSSGKGNSGDGAGLSISAPASLCGGSLSEEDKWIENENCKKVGADSAGPCLQLTMAIKGGGPVCCGGYDGHSDAVEKQHKKEAKNGFESMKKACEIIQGIQQAGAADDAKASIVKLTEARDLALQASGVYGFWNSAAEQLPHELPLFERYPQPLGPTAIAFDTAACKDDDGCKAACTAAGEKLVKQSQECVDNLNKMLTWFQKKRKEAIAFAADLDGAIKHMQGKVGGGGTGANAPLGTGAASPIRPVDNGRGGITSPSSGGSGGAAASGASSSSAGSGVSNVASGGASDTSTVDASLLEGESIGPDLSGLSEADALAAIIEASGGSLGQLAGGEGGRPPSASAALNAINHATIAIPGLATPAPAYAVAPLSQAGNLPVGKNVYLLNSLTLAKEQVFMNPTTKRPDVQLRALTGFERITRRHFGENGDRRLQLEKAERERQKAKSAKSPPKGTSLN